MLTLNARHLSCPVVLLIAMTAQAQDLQIEKTITVGGNVLSKTETSIQGARERTVSHTPAANVVTLRQCDLQRTVTINEQAQTYFVQHDPQDDAALKAAAMFSGVPQSDSGGYITETAAITDTGERKTMYGYPARHLKMKVSVEPSKNACSQQSQEYEVEGWYADVSKEFSSCQQAVPPVRQTEGCNDRVIHKRSGSGRPGYPVSQNLILHNPDGSTTEVGFTASEITKQTLDKNLFEVPAGYREVKSLAELNGVPNLTAAQPTTAYATPPQPSMAPAQSSVKKPSMAAMMFGSANATGQQMMGGAPGNPYGGGGMQPAGATAVAVPQVLGPKAPGKIRVGVAPPDAQLGQGNNAGADYSTPIRNVEVSLMNGPAVEIAALESHAPLQLQAEAQQKQCDYILFSGVVVKRSSAGGFGKFMKIGSTAASFNPAVMMTKSVGTMVAAQSAAAASQMAAQQMQQQAVSQLAGFNGQIKSKDDVTVQYQLVATAQNTPVLQNTLQGKAKSDGEDVLTPLLQQTANAVLTQVIQK
ncbi:MAG TPA: hypothetical protein VIX37_17860 [Candidatus Sulfotelmatobacter sp.]